MTVAEYVKRQCRGCSGTGRSFDSTAQDKVNAGPYATGTCTTCRGGGFTAHRADIVDSFTPVRAEVDASDQGIPDWMC